MKTKHILVATVITVFAAVNMVTITMVWQASKVKYVAELHPADQFVKHTQR